MNEQEPDDSVFDEDEDDDAYRDYDYYLCNCCGHDCVTDHGGWGCPKCGAIMEGQYY